MIYSKEILRQRYVQKCHYSKANAFLISGTYFEKSILHGFDYTRCVHCNSRCDWLGIRLVLESVA
jgi:hypothetical protein